MSTFRLLHVRRFFEHRLRTVLSVSGIAIGAALVVAVLGLFGSLNGSVESFVSDLSGVGDLEISAQSDDGFADQLFFEIEEAEDVKAAVPMMRSPVLVNGERAILLGLDQRARALGTSLSNAEQSRLENRAERPGIFLGKPLADELSVVEGGSVSIFAGGKETRLEVLAVLEGESARFNQGKFVGTALPLAQLVLDRPGRLDSVVVVLDEGADPVEAAGALSKVVGDRGVVTSPSQRADQARLATRDLQAGMLMGTAMAVTVGAFLIFNTMNMAATERRRELATLRALGGRKRKLLWMFLLESAALGLAGSILGAILGVVAAKRLVAGIPSFFVSAIGVEMGFQLPPYSIPAALIVGVLASVFAAYLPARRAVAVSPVESMRPEGTLESVDFTNRVARVPTALGLVLMVGGGTLSIWGPPQLGFIWVASMIAGVLVASWGLTAPIAAATAAIASPAGVSGKLASSALARAPRRAWATSAAVVVATGMVVAQNGMFANLTDSVNRVVSSLGKIDLYVAASDGASFAEVRLPGDWQDDLESIPGVNNVGINYFTFITYDGQKVLLQGIEGSVGEAPSLARATQQDIEALYSGAGAIVSTRFEELYGIGEGDTLRLPTSAGEKSFEVVSVAPQFTWERGHVTLGRQAIIDYFNDETVTDYMLTFEDKSDPAVVRKQVEAFVRQAPRPVHLMTGADQVRIIFATVDQINSMFAAMSWVVVGAATLAIFNALLISVLERRRELGIMRAIGTSRRQLRRMVAVEAASLGIMGGLIGTGTGFILHRASMGAIIATSGFPIDYEFLLSPAAGAFVVGVAIAVFGSLLPARRAATVNIIEAIGYE